MNYPKRYTDKRRVEKALRDASQPPVKPKTPRSADELLIPVCGPDRTTIWVRESRFLARPERWQPFFSSLEAMQAHLENWRAKKNTSK
jgi:hypothetical protein